MLNISIFYVLLLCINKTSVFMGIFHMVDMVILIFKAEWVHFWSVLSNFSLRRSYGGCISVFLSILTMIHFCGCFEGDVLCLNFPLWKMVLWSDKFPVFHNVALTIISLLFCWFHIQGSNISVTGLIRSLVFEIIWVDAVD